MMNAPGHEAQYNDDSPVFEAAGGGLKGADAKQPALGGLGGFPLDELQPRARVFGLGESARARQQHPSRRRRQGEGFDPRGHGHRDDAPGGATAESEPPWRPPVLVQASSRDRRKLEPLGFQQHCKDHPCSGASHLRMDSGATALAILTYLAAGQTHKSTGPYRDTIHKGVAWL